MYKMRTKKCEFCGSKFETQKPKQKFCSIDCANKSHAVEYVEKVCDYCGKTYKVIPSRADSSHYCSNECKFDAQARNREVKQCLICEKDYRDYRGSHGICKSKECHEKYDYLYNNQNLFPQHGVKEEVHYCPICLKKYVGQLPVCSYVCWQKTEEKMSHNWYLYVEREVNKYKKILEERGELAPTK